MAAGGTDTWLCQLQCPLASCLPVELSTGCEVPASLGAACVFLCVLQNSELQAQKFGSLLHSWALFLLPLKSAVNWKCSYGAAGVQGEAGPANGARPLGRSAPPSL